MPPSILWSEGVKERSEEIHLGVADQEIISVFRHIRDKLCSRTMGILQDKDTDLKIASNPEDGSEDGVPLRSRKSEMTWSICLCVQKRHIAERVILS